MEGVGGCMMNYSCNPQTSHCIRKTDWGIQQRALTLTRTNSVSFQNSLLGTADRFDLLCPYVCYFGNDLTDVTQSSARGPTCWQEVATSADPVTITLRTKRTCTQTLTRRSQVFCHSVVCIVAVCVRQCVPNAFCCWCARACLCVQASVKSLFFTFLHAELLWLPSRCQCVKTANERQREEGGRKKRWQNINCLLANHPHITRRLSLYLPHCLCLFLTFSYTCI